MLRKIRLTCGIICLTLITLLFLDFTGTLHGWFGWLAKDPVPPCSTGIERRGSSPFNHPDRSIRPNLLLGDLSVGGISRCSSLDWQKAEKVTLLLFSRSLPPTLRGIGNIHHHPGGRSKFHRNPICSLQCLRAYRKQPVPTHLAVGKQPVRPFSRTGRQLCIL